MKTKEQILQLDFKERIKFLYENQDEIKQVKKSAIKHCDVFDFTNKSNANKSLFTSHSDDLESGILKRSLIGNTYNWLDSHDDLHVGNTFKKSITDKNANQILFFHDHINSLTSKLGYFESIEEVKVFWQDLGIEKSGMTTVLLFEANIEQRRNKIIFEDYAKGLINQHSVGMRYIKIDLALNSTDTEFKEQKDLFDRYISNIGNKEKAIEQGFFWAVTEAELKELSAVTQGSNEITYTVQNIEPLKDTQKGAETQDEEKEINKKLLENFKLFK
jgi:hypothetical protein